MKALHICLDHNFIENSKKIFDKYYPDQNIFIVNSKKSTFDIIKNGSGFKIYDLTKTINYTKIERICKENNIDKVILHGISFGLLPLIRHLKGKLEFKIYWIFWGYELYQLIGYENNYKLVDSKINLFSKETYYLPNRISKFFRKIMHKYLPDTVKGLLPYINYFCFWNKSDYDLLLKYYNYPIKFKYFAYGSNFKGCAPSNLFSLKEKDSKIIMINHQASFWGNHNTVFNRITKIDKDNQFIKLVPLSYGSNEIRKKVYKQGKSLFGTNFKPILKYMSRDDYFDILKDVDIAVFGHRRQEASGNIIQMLKNGVKVFLRNDNNLLDFYRKQGYIIFSFEDDLKNMKSLESLSIEEKEYNRNCYLSNIVYYDDFMPSLFS